MVLLTLILTTMTSLASAKSAVSISFEVSFSEPQAHYAEIKMDVTGLKKEYFDVKMPVWTPGSYLVREYSRHVESFHANDEQGNPIKVEKISKNTWRIHSNNKDKATINYRVYGFEVSVRTNYIDDSHAFLSPAATFMYIDGMIDQPAEIKIIPHANWASVSTGLDVIPGKTNTFYSRDFDILFDSPIEIGNQDIFTFEASGVLHEVAMVGGGNYDKERISKDFAELIEECTRIFGVNPNKRYVFIIHNFKSGGGGLEHLNSTVLGASRNGYTNPRTYTNFLALAAHEYFHLWLVKRIRPIELGPFNYDEENYSTGLWIMEGFTSYYDNLIMKRAGFIDEQAYFNYLAVDFDAVENRPGNLIQPVALASMDAWIKYYRPDENSANTSVSYYNKGALLAMLIDLKIIAETNGKHSLDDVLKASYDEFYINKKRGFEEHELEALIEKVTGVSVAEIFQMAHTVEPIDYNKYLNPVGYSLVNYAENLDISDLGATTNNQNGRIMVTAVSRASSAWDAGLNAKDEIIAINGERIDLSGRELNAFIQQFKIGESLKLLISRDGMIRELNVPLKKDNKGAFSIVQRNNATADQAKLGQIWLSSRN